MTRSQYITLIEEMNKYSHAYHVENVSLISDELYDSKFRQLLMFEKQSPKHISADSPTQRVGEVTDVSQFSRAKHYLPMYSLENAFSEKDLIRFLKRFYDLRKKHGTEKVDNFYLDYKMDGVAVELFYSEGQFAKAITRGDGNEGQDVTKNVAMIPNVPSRIRTKGSVVVRGEVVVHIEEFYIINGERENKNIKPFSNARHYASGSLMQHDPQVTRKRNLRFYAYELLPIVNKHDESYYMTSEDQIKTLRLLGFGTPNGQLCSSISEIQSFVNEVSRIKNDLPYKIDGVVIKQNNREYKDELGYNNHAPLFSIAWKFSDEGKETYIDHIHWSMGRSGRLTPVASLDPIDIDGIRISEVNLFNAEYVENNKLGSKAKVLVVRGGDVIPKIHTIITPGSFEDVPSKCPYCNEPTGRSVNNVHLRCNNSSCPAILSATISYIVSREVLDIKGIGEQTAKEIVSSETITDITDLFLPLDNKSDKVSQELLDNLVKRMRNINLAELLLVLGINGIGKAVAGKLTLEVVNLKGFIHLLNNEEEMRLLPISQVIKTTLNGWYSNPYNKQLLNTIEAFKLPLLSR